MSDTSEPERQLWLVRHGQTEWARLGRHTGRTDIPLDDVGREQARALGRRLAGPRNAHVLSSPRTRAFEPALLAGFGEIVQVDPDLREWDYGDLEGLTTSEIREMMPGWSIWTGPWPGGETPDEVGARADRVIQRCLAPDVKGDVLLFAHGHILRVLAARWLRQPPAGGSMFALATATISALGWERENRVVELWNEAAHLED